ncbi:DNA repair protein RecO [Kiloniella sp. b19]|uniref:DNA repair protein RecO n=1 Tax=Kiloniella sp. GXU_MW_B19 TaxID=3141326 RepID=UPI0031DAFEC7
MIVWEDQAIVLSVRPFGEDGLIASVLTAEQGKRAGLIRAGQSQKRRAIFEPGNRLDLRWSGRLDEHLGHFEGEVNRSYPALVMDEPARLSALLSALSISDFVVPDREGLPAFFQGLDALLEALNGDFWAAVYVRWELSLLAALGFALDLDSCAGGGDADKLAYVSPKSGRAVSEEAGEPYRDKLLPLPGFLVGRPELDDEAIGRGLDLSAHFLRKHLFHPQNRDLPAVRDRLMENFVTEL